MGARIKYNFGAGQKRGILVCIISGRGRKTMGASAPTASIRSAPLLIINSFHTVNTTVRETLHVIVKRLKNV